MKFQFAHLSFFVAGLAASACFDSNRHALDPSVVAVVDKEGISKAEFERELMRELDSLGIEGQKTQEQRDSYKKVLLKTAIDRTLWLNFARANNVTVTQDEVDRRVLMVSSEYPNEKFDAVLAQGQMSKADLLRRTQQELMVERVIESQVYSRVAIADSAVRAYYDSHTDEFALPEEVHAVQVVAKTIEEAKKAQTQLQQGKKFSEVALRFSISPEAKVGGDLGFFRRGVMPPQFDEALFTLPVGRLSDIVLTDYGYHLFKVLEKRASRKENFDEAKVRIEKKLLKDARSKAQTDKLEALRHAASIRINEPVLESVTGAKSNNGGAS